MDSQESKWNEYYSSEVSQTTDPWLHRYSEYFMNCGKVLDVGSGNGSNVAFLQEMNTEIVALDYSKTAIDHIKKKWRIDAAVHDIRQALPFSNDSFDMILADLSLHYFSYLETVDIIAELYRITKTKGFLIARVNSIKDDGHGSGIGIEVERNFFDFNGRRKRFFDKEMVYDLFDSNFVVTKTLENSTNKYENEKNLWEIVAVKIA